MYCWQAVDEVTRGPGRFPRRAWHDSPNWQYPSIPLRWAGVSRCNSPNVTAITRFERWSMFPARVEDYSSEGIRSRMVEEAVQHCLVPSIIQVQGQLEDEVLSTGLNACAQNCAKHRPCSFLALALRHVRDRQPLRHRRWLSGRLFLSGARPCVRRRANRQRRSVRGPRGRRQLDLGVEDSPAHLDVHVRRGCRAST